VALVALVTASPTSEPFLFHPDVCDDGFAGHDRHFIRPLEPIRGKEQALRGAFAPMSGENNLRTNWARGKSEIWIVVNTLDRAGGYF